MSASDSADWSSCPTPGGCFKICLLFNSPIEVFVQSLQACNQYSAKASTFQLAHQNFILVCLPVQLSGCLPKRCFFLLSLYFFFFFKVNCIRLNGFCICLSRCAAAGPTRQSVHILSRRPSFFFVSWSVNKVQAEGRKKKCEKSQTSKVGRLDNFAFEQKGKVGGTFV